MHVDERPSRNLSEQVAHQMCFVGLRLWEKQSGTAILGLPMFTA